MSEVPRDQQDTVDVTVSRRAAERLKGGHLWVYRTEIERSSGTFLPGGLVRILDNRGTLLGCGTYSSTSTIAVRLVTRGEAVDRAGFLETVRQRVAAALGLREELAPLSQSTDSRRLIFSEADGLPGVVADQYGPLVILQLLTQGMAADDVREVLRSAFKAHLGGMRGGLTGVSAGSEESGSDRERLTVWERPDPRIRELEELPPSPPEPLLVTGDEAETATVFHLNGIGFHFDIGAGQKTGAFLDQRLNYEAAARAVLATGGAASSRALDVCTYQGGFALHLARVCERVTGVDASRAALEVADRNLELNREKLPGEVDWIEADAFELLRAFEEAGERFGTIVLDPPAFAKSKRAVEGAMRGYKELNLRALKMLEPGGVLVTCSCSHHVSEPEFREAVRSAAADAGKTVQVLETRGAAPDHPEVLTLPETRYLKCLVCRVG